MKDIIAIIAPGAAFIGGLVAGKLLGFTVAISVICAIAGIAIVYALTWRNS